MYDAELLDHNMHPEFKGEIAGIEPIRLLNTSCGDELLIYLEVKDQKIIDGRFAGHGCAISLASADVFIKSIKGKTVAEAKELAVEFSKMVIGEEFDTEKLEKARCLACVSRMPARVKCAKLAWKSLEKLA